MSNSPFDGVPHRYPFRLVDRAEVISEERVAVTLASAGGTMTGCGPWPVTLVAEALAQALILAIPGPKGRSVRLVGLDRVRLSQGVGAGDRLEIQVCERAELGSMRRFSSRATRSGALVAVAEVTVMG